MITKVQIENFKSIEKLSLSLGRVNVLIGENGCGKTNILEGIAMAAAVGDAKNLNGHLGNRGVRVTPSAFMRASFEGKKQSENIVINLEISGELDYDAEFQHDNSPYSNWEALIPFPSEHFKGVKHVGKLEENLKTFVGYNEKIDKLKRKKILTYLDLFAELGQIVNKEVIKRKVQEINNLRKKITPINNFVIYAPENHFLRKTDEIGTVEPLGYRGEGLIKLISVLHKEKPEAIEEIKKHLRLISWFEDFEIVNDVFTGSYVKIRDAYLGKDIFYPNLKSTNEGFLFLLFYLTLFIAEYTPKFFAIDNIDNALNPKLCRELVKVLAQLAKKYDKQVIFTTHNPAVLDGLNLDDDEQRLFVVYRNAEGRTKTRRVKKRATPEGYEPMKMSEQYMNGFIGGLPKNF